MRPAIQRFGRDQRGAAALEFALLVPFLVTLEFGSVELVRAYEAQRRVAHVAAAMADVVSQGTTVSTAQLNDAFISGQVLVAPLPTTPLGLRISSITADARGVASVDWTTSQNWTGAAAPSIPAGYLNPGESAIVADATYNWDSPLKYLLPNTIHFVKHAYVRPRLSAQVQKV